jgi:sarcosine oxidase subunit beta
MARYSLLRVLSRAMRSNRTWPATWRDASPRSAYDVIVVGGGGHGLATAYYLAKTYGVKRVAVLEKGWIGAGNSGRNTQVIRSNYFHPVSSSFFDHSLKLYESLSRELNFNVMLSQRGIINLAHSDHELELARRWVNAVRMNDVDADLITTAEIARMVPILNVHSRYPVVGGLIQRRAGISRHDSVVWAFARGASSLGVDIVQGCEVRGLHIEQGKIAGVDSSSGRIKSDRVVMSVAGQSSLLSRSAGLRLPITTMTLQAMVSEPVKPILNTVVVSGLIHSYVSQSDRGEIVIGGGADGYNSYAQRGSLRTFRSTVAATVELFPCFSRLKIMRQWGGAVDITPDTSPIMGLTPIRGLYLNCGWGTGGYKAIPAGGDTMAYTAAHDRPHPLIQGFSLGRFVTGALVDEGAASGVAH